VQWSPFNLNGPNPFLSRMGACSRGEGSRGRLITDNRMNFSMPELRLDENGRCGESVVQTNPSELKLGRA
jgi:hypothetical protein